jgi:hypothetical protein
MLFELHKEVLNDYEYCTYKPLFESEDQSYNLV